MNFYYGSVLAFFYTYYLDSPLYEAFNTLHDMFCTLFVIYFFIYGFLLINLSTHPKLPLKSFQTDNSLAF